MMQDAEGRRHRARLFRRAPRAGSMRELPARRAGRRLRPRCGTRRRHRASDRRAGLCRFPRAAGAARNRCGQHLPAGPAARGSGDRGGRGRQGDPARKAARPDAATARRIVAAVEESGVRLMVGHILRFDPRYVQVYDAAAPEKLGDADPSPRQAQRHPLHGAGGSARRARSCSTWASTTSTPCNGSRARGSPASMRRRSRCSAPATRTRSTPWSISRTAPSAASTTAGHGPTG